MKGKAVVAALKAMIMPGAAKKEEDGFFGTKKAADIGPQLL